MRQPHLNFDTYIRHPRGYGVIRIPSELLCLPRSQHYAFLCSRYRDHEKVRQMYAIAKHLHTLTRTNQMHRVAV